LWSIWHRLGQYLALLNCLAASKRGEPKPQASIALADHSNQVVNGKAANSPPGDSEEPGESTNVNPEEGIGVFRGLLLTFLLYILLGLCAFVIWVAWSDPHRHL
jgi:hypothetical protein